MIKKSPSVSVDIIILKNNKILLVKLGNKWSDNGKYEWGLPGREIEIGDTFEKACIKNLKEETDMQLKNFKVICVNNNFALGNHYISIGILAEAEGEPKVNNPEDWKLWKWFDAKNMPDKLFPPADLTIKCFLNNKITC